MTKNELEALKFARDISGGNYLFQLMAYIVKIASLEPGAVSVYKRKLKLNKPDTLIYNHPWEADLDEIEGEELEREYERLETEEGLLQVGTPDYGDQEMAAGWAKVSRRTIQRWEKEGLQSIKHRNQRIYLKEDISEWKSWHPGR